ncbi:MAG: hypothetical protein NC218_03345 [Acetobacter sp.]|nr:hypothetical protein [Acetobacter sp.]
MIKIHEHLSALDKVKSDLKTFDNDALIFLGAGGEEEEWRNGVNEMLEEANIIEKGKGWQHIYRFTAQGGIKILVFPFDEQVAPDMGKLAMWRLQHRHMDAMWLSDWMDQNESWVEEQA